MNGDIKGYYARLGLQPSASLEDIKRAFRRLAKELHPDRNHSPDANQRFQAIQEAYDVLSDPDRRADYDGLQFNTEQDSTNEYFLDPIACSRCGRVTAQPRYVIFYRVVSYIFATARTPVQGVFCHACARKEAWKATLITSLFGWWGFPWGPLWTIPAVVRNALGGRQPTEANEKLCWYNACAFFTQRKFELAQALGRELRRAQDEQIALNALRMIDEIQRITGGLNSNRELKNPWNSSYASVAGQLALLLIVPATAAILISADEPRGTRNIRAEPPGRPMTQAAGSASRHSSDAQSQGPSKGLPIPSPIPTNKNRFSDLVPPTVPSSSQPSCAVPAHNGRILSASKVAATEAHALEINNGSGSDAIVKVKDLTGRTVVSLFVKRGAEASYSRIPDGEYTIQFAFGDTLGADCRSFLKLKSAQQFPGTRQFRAEYGRNEIVYQILSFTLHSVAGGNIRPNTIPQAIFLAD